MGARRPWTIRRTGRPYPHNSHSLCLPEAGKRRRICGVHLNLSPPVLHTRIQHASNEGHDDNPDIRDSRCILLQGGNPMADGRSGTLANDNVPSRSGEIVKEVSLSLRQQRVSVHDDASRCRRRDGRRNREPFKTCRWHSKQANANARQRSEDSNPVFHDSQFSPGPHGSSCRNFFLRSTRLPPASKRSRPNKSSAVNHFVAPHRGYGWSRPDPIADVDERAASFLRPWVLEP